jgi:hypothetical protein
VIWKKKSKRKFFRKKNRAAGDDSSCKKHAHSTFGEDYDDVKDVKGEPPATHQALQRALGFLDNRISHRPHLRDYPDQQPCPPQFICYPESPKAGK